MLPYLDENGCTDNERLPDGVLPRTFSGIRQDREEQEQEQEQEPLLHIT
jgi:hypothetical protein